MAQPDLILTPFAQDAPPSAVDNIPEVRSPSDPLEKATWTQGFPGLTMIPLAAGGVPPRGQDFNGVLRAISEHTVFQGGGGKYKWSAEYVAASGGYSVGAVIQSDDGLSAYVSLIDGNSDNFNVNPASIGASWSPFSGSAQSGGVYTLSASGSITASMLGLVLLDASGGNRTYTLPAANAALGVREVTLRRVDASSNALTIAASDTDKLMLDTTSEVAGQASTELLFSGDFLRLRSDGAGKWWCVGQAQLPGSIASGLIVFNAPGVSTFTVPPYMRSGRVKPKITVTGSGGGGSAGDTGERGGGGGAAATVIGVIDLTGVSSVPLTIAAGGRNGEFFPGGGGQLPANGAASSFGSYISAGGGAPGARPNGAESGAGGAGSAVGAGGLVLFGGDGGDGNPIINPALRTGGGYGGASYWGGGSAGRSGAISKVGAYGSGGAGGGDRTIGGFGAGGVIVIEW